MLFLCFSLTYLFKEMIQEIILSWQGDSFQHFSWLMVESKAKFPFVYFAQKDASAFLVRAELISVDSISSHWLPVLLAVPSDTGSELGLSCSLLSFTLRGRDKLSCDYFFPMCAKAQAQPDKFSSYLASALGFRVNLNLSVFACLMVWMLNEAGL